MMENIKLKFFSPSEKEIIKIGNEIRPASFVNGIKRYNQTRLIVELIKKSIIEQSRITIKEIVDCYIQNKFQSENSVAIGWYENKEGEWRHYYVDKKLYLKYYNNNGIESKAKSWFMSNLGAAIIKGKLLVIPVIDIETKQITQR